MSEKTMTGDEQQEYIAKLQAGKVQLPLGASELEKRILEGLLQQGQRARQVNASKGDAVKQIEALQQRVKAMDSEVEAISGEMTGYARLLISVEEKRRAADVPAATVDSATRPAAKKPGPPKGAQPAHLKVAKSNGKTEHTPPADAKHDAETTAN